MTKRSLVPLASAQSPSNRRKLLLVVLAPFLQLFGTLPTTQSFVIRPRSSWTAPNPYHVLNAAVDPTPEPTVSAGPTDEPTTESINININTKKVVIIGGGWGGLSTAHALANSNNNDLQITLIDASPRVGGVVRDGFKTTSGERTAEAGQHGFWDNYHNIFQLLKTDLSSVLDVEDVLTGYAEQGQYSPRGLEAVWPVYRDQTPQLPTGLAQALYTKFQNLSILDRATAVPLVLAFSEFDDSPSAWEKYDSLSFRELCLKLGVSKKCYEEAFEPMILTGLFAPGRECSAAAALGMAYFFVLKSQNSFDVRWCRGNIGEVIFQPWVQYLEGLGVIVLTDTKCVGFTEGDTNQITSVSCASKDTSFNLEADDVVFAVGAGALNAISRSSPLLSQYPEFRNFTYLRGTSVLATRIYLDTIIDTPYSANACWGFDAGVGMTVFDITKLHGRKDGDPGSVLEVDFYYSNSLLGLSDDALTKKVKSDLDTIFGQTCINSNVIDAAIIRLPNAVNWYFPGSYSYMPETQSSSLSNVYFAGDIVKSRHGSWSQEKAYVTGIEAANAVLGREAMEDVITLEPDEPHVALGREVVSSVQKLLGGNAPSLVDFLW